MGQIQPIMVSDLLLSYFFQPKTEDKRQPVSEIYAEWDIFTKIFWNSGHFPFKVQCQVSLNSNYLLLKCLFHDFSSLEINVS